MTEVAESARPPRRFRRYPEYKSSGVAWLGDLPSHWKPKRFKFGCSRSALYGANESAESYSLDGIRFLRTTDIDDSGSLVDDGAVYLPEELVQDYLLSDGDILISRSGTLGRALHYQRDVHGPCAYAGYLVRFVPKPTLDPRFAFYFTKSKVFVGWLSVSAIQSTIGNINGQKYGNLHLPDPALGEQRAIADFLDRETARIDQLVEKKRRMVEVLGEKRQAVISRAVTKGLDADVPMKDSGVVWLGDIPVHWDVKQLRRAIMFQRGHDLPTDEREEGEVVIVSSSGVSSTHSRAIAKAPGIVTGRYGTIGQFHLINQDYWPLNTTLYSINLYGNEPRFLLYMLAHMSPQFLAHAVKSAVPGVDRKDVHADHVAVPPISEQRAIAAFLDRETVRIDTLVTKIRETIDRLREFRSALITAAVTGQIDVSTWSNQGTSDRRLDQIEEATSA